MASKNKPKSSSKKAKASVAKSPKVKKVVRRAVSKAPKAKTPAKSTKPKKSQPKKSALAKAKAPAKGASKAPEPKKSQLKSKQGKLGKLGKAPLAKKSAPTRKGNKSVAAPLTAAQKARLRLQAQKEKEREKKELEREKEQLKKQKEREKKELEREKEQLKKQKEREKKELEREKEQLKKQKEREKKELEREKEQLKKQKEREKEELKQQKEFEREELKQQKELEKKERERALENERKEKEKEKERLRKEKEKERLRLEKEHEAYRKAREGAREKVRAEKEAARRALEGRVAQQARRAQRIAGTARGSSARVYRPDAIPSQAGTRREGMMGVRSLSSPIALRTSNVRQTTPSPPPRAAIAATLEERWATIRERLSTQPERFQAEYAESFDMSWIHHDSALEGVVYTYQELKTAVDPNIVIVPDSSLQPVCEEIRRHKKALEWARELGQSDVPLSAEVLKKLLILLHPEEGDLKSVKYRKEIPQHRLYFHDYAPPDKIAVRIRQAFDWLHGPEPGKLKDPIRVAARLHYDLLRTFPFPQDSGKVARLSMNILLMRAGLPPVIVHSTERQRYYDALRGSLPTIVSMVNESMRNAMTSIEKVLDEEDVLQSH